MCDTSCYAACGAAAVAAGLALLVWQQSQNGVPSLAAMANAAPVSLARPPRRDAVLVFGASGKLGREVVQQASLCKPCVASECWLARTSACVGACWQPTDTPVHRLYVLMVLVKTCLALCATHHMCWKVPPCVRAACAGGPDSGGSHARCGKGKGSIHGAGHAGGRGRP